MMDWQIITKWASRKGVLGVVAIAAIAGAFGPVTTPAIIGISGVAAIGIAAFALIDWQKEKNNVDEEEE